MSKRMIDLLFSQGAMLLDRRDATFRPWRIEDLRERSLSGSGHSVFHEAETLVVDNVTKYLYEVCEQEEWGGEDYPNCAPPFPTFWMESRAPSFVRSGKVVRPWSGHHAWGALFVATEVPANLQDVLTQPDTQARIQDELQAQWQVVVHIFAQHGLSIPQVAPPSTEAQQAWFAALPAECRHYLQHYLTLHGALAVLEGTPMPVHGVRWHYQMLPFLQLTSHDGIRGPLMQGVALVGHDGRLVAQRTVDGGEQFVQWSIQDGDRLHTEQRRQFASLGNVMLMPMLLALSFLHCKNVTITSEDPCHQRKPPKKGEPCRRLHYKVLNIQPMQEVLRREGGQQHQGLKKALHICRGHFADYRLGKGLFGRHHGLYWFDPHIRGKSRQGIVAKDYAIHAPDGPVAAHGEVPSHA